MKKILVIRMSSIGDIVLTSPILRCLKLQSNSEIHFLTKIEYIILLKSNPHVDKVFGYQSNLKNIISELKNEKYDFIIDLHNNMRSFWVKTQLRCKSFTVKKQNFRRFMLIYLGIGTLHTHVVDRYFNCIRKLNIINDNLGLDYFIPETVDVNYDIKKPYIAWSIGASHAQKSLSARQIINVCNNLSIPVVLLGGKNEKNKGNLIIQESTHNHIHNFCGFLNLDQSSYLLKNSTLVLSNDTGLMHIAASFQKPIISFWGCTKPDLGFYPYMSHFQSVQLVFNSEKEPCSKHGNYCKIQKDGCVKKIDYMLINNTILEILG